MTYNVKNNGTSYADFTAGGTVRTLVAGGSAVYDFTDAEYATAQGLVGLAFNKLDKEDAALLAADGAIPIQDGNQYITKAGVALLTLAAPTTVTHDGMSLRLVNTTANAHVVTAVGLRNGTTGGDKTTITFAAFPGSSIRLLAYGGKWYVIENTAAPVT